MTSGSADRAPIGPLGKPFWTLWSASAVSNLADGVFKIVVPLIAVTVTRDPGLIAGLTVAATLPWLVFALPAGAFIDRADRRHVMLAADALRAALVVALTLLVWPDLTSIWLLYVVAVAIGTAEVLYDTSAQSILPQVVARGQLSRANGRLYAVELTANQFVGPPLGGLLFGVGAVVALAMPGALWFLAVVALWFVRGSFRVDRTERTTLRSDIVEGLRFLWHNSVLRTLAIMTGVSNFAGNAVFALLVLYAVGPESAMGLTEAGYGLLLTASAIGSLLGSLVAERVVRLIGRSAGLAVTIVGSALLQLTPGFTASAWVVGAALVFGGFTIAIWNITVVSLRQGITPPALLGRLNSAYRLLAWGSIPLGAATGGWLAQWLGLRPVFVVMAAVTLALLVLMPLVSNARLDRAEQDADPDTAAE